MLRTVGFDVSYVKAEGQYLYDVNGRQYLDMLAGYAVNNCGRNHPKIRHALIDYLNSDHPSLVKFEAPLASGLLAEELKKRLPSSLDTVFFTNSGTEGIETAIKYSRCSTGRPRIVYCNHSFHGLTNGSLSLTGESWFRDGFYPLLPDCTAVDLNDLIPGVALQQLWELAGVVDRVLFVVAACVVLAGLLGMMTALLTSLNERRRELAILRSVGARPLDIFALLALEGSTLAVFGAALGALWVGVLVLLLAPWLQANYGLTLQAGLPRPAEWPLLAGIIAVGAVASLLPGWRAYRLSLADGMTPRL